MRIRVITATRHGATTHVGDIVADELTAAGHEVERVNLAETDDLAVVAAPGADAAVLGASVYTGAWLERARIAQQHLLAAGVPTYAFAVGVLGVTQEVTDPAWTSPRTAETQAERVVFGGTIRLKGLSVRERSLLAVVRAKEGEYTSWDDVHAWARAVAADVAARGPRAA